MFSVWWSSLRAWFEVQAGFSVFCEDVSVSCYSCCWFFFFTPILLVLFLILLRCSCAYRVSYMEGSSLQGFWFQDEMRLPAPPPILPSRQGLRPISSALLDGASAATEPAPPQFDLTVITAAYRTMHTLQQYLEGANALTAPHIQPQLPLLQQQWRQQQQQTTQQQGVGRTGGGIKASFGCHMEETNLFLTQRASGIWGLEVWNSFGPPTFPYSVLLEDLHVARPPSTSGSNSSGSPLHHVPPPVFTQRFIHHNSPVAETNGEERTGNAPDGQGIGLQGTLQGQRLFAMCLSEHGGLLTFGGAHEEFHLQPPQWTPIIGMRDSYNVRLAAVRIGGRVVPLLPHQDAAAAARQAEVVLSHAGRRGPPSETWGNQIPPGGLRKKDTLLVLIDSGSTLAYFPRPLYKQIVTAIESHLQRNRRRANGSRRLNHATYQTQDEQEQQQTAADVPVGQGVLRRPLPEEEVEVAAPPQATAAAAAAAAAAAQEEAEAAAQEEAASSRHAKEGPSDGASSSSTIDSGNSSVDSRRLLQQFGDNPLADIFGGNSSSDRNWSGDNLIVNNSKKTDATTWEGPLGEEAAAASAAAPGAGPTKPVDLFSIHRVHPEVASRGPLGLSPPRLVAEPERRPRVQHPQQRPHESVLLAAAAAAAAAAEAYEPSVSGTPVIPEHDPSAASDAAAAASEGTEVPDTEALPVLVALSSVPAEEYSESAAYKLLPHSAPPRKSQAVKVEATSGEVCYFLPRGRKDLREFPTIELLFLPAFAGGAAGNTSAPQGERLQEQWVVWRPHAYLYGKGNEHYRCLAISEDSSSQDSAVLGSSFFIGKDVIMHVQEEKLGFAEANCPSIKLRDRPELPKY